MSYPEALVTVIVAIITSMIAGVILRCIEDDSDGISLRLLELAGRLYPPEERDEFINEALGNLARIHGPYRTIAHAAGLVFAAARVGRRSIASPRRTAVADVRRMTIGDWAVRTFAVMTYVMVVIVGSSIGLVEFADPARPVSVSVYVAMGVMLASAGILAMVTLRVRHRARVRARDASHDTGDRWV